MQEKMIELIASVDQGTQSTRVQLYDAQIRCVGSAQKRHKQHFPQSGWVEHDAVEIMNNIRELLSESLNDARTRLKEDHLVIKGLGVTNQRETTVVWNKSNGKPLYNAIVWLDTRTKSVVDELVSKHGGVDAFRKKSGLPINTYFSGTKIKWLIDNVQSVREAMEKGVCCFGTIDTWIIWNLTGGPNGGAYITDVTNASRTQLMDIETCKWCPELLEAFGPVPIECLPVIRSSAEIYGYIVESGCQEFDGVPVCGNAGDQQAATIGQGVFQRGQVKCTYGTGAFILINTGETPVQSRAGLLTTPCYQLGPDEPVVYALEGSIAIAGAAVSWLKDNLGAIDTPQETEALLSSVPTTAGVYFVPAFSGLFAPRWRQDARGCIMGLTQHTRKGHIVRALMESVGFQLNEIVEAMLSDMEMKQLQLIRVDGGMSRNSAFLQLTSDLCGCCVERPEDPEVTAAGAAIAAGLGCKFWKSMDHIKKLLLSASEQWSPKLGEKERQDKIRLWNKAVQRSFGWV